MMGGPAGAQSGWHTAVFAINLVNPQYKKKDRKKKKVSPEASLCSITKALNS